VSKSRPFTTRVCGVDELPQGSRRIVQVDRREIAVINEDGRYYAIRNRCPHQGGPVGRGEIGGTLLPSDPGRLQYGLPGRVLTCPWHHWEFDLEDGSAIFDRKMRVKTYDVIVDGGEIRVVAGGGAHE
jgi:nitrite reductase (NADH) small subunit